MLGILPYPSLTPNPSHRTSPRPTPPNATPTPYPLHLPYPDLPYPTITPNQPHPPAPPHTTSQPNPNPYPLPPIPYPLPPTPTLPYPCPTPPNPYFTPVLPYTALPYPTTPYPTLSLYMQVRSDVSEVLLSISKSKFGLVLSVRSVSFRSVKLKAIGTDRMNSVKSVDSMPELSKLYNCWLNKCRIVTC